MSEGVTGGALSPWFVLLRDLSVKSTLLLLAAWALTLAMRRASAATRHLVWLLTFAGLLLLPLLSLTLPPRPVAVLPAAPPDAPLVLLRGSLAPRSEDRRLAPNSGGTGKNPEKRSFPSGSPRVGGGEAILMRPAWTTFLGILWLMGVLLAAFPFDIGWFLAVQRIRRCSPVTDAATLALAAEAGRQLGLRCPVPLRSGASVAVPMTFGLLRPVVLLPDGAASWAAERLRVALLHEMAHVRRGDWAIQTTARLVCALFWHNPLVWPAARMLRAEAERACDDLVLSLGIPAPDYAQHLLAVAAALSGATRPLPLAVSMAGRGPLESRLRAVLTIRPRRAPSRRLAACAFALALIVVVPLAILRPAARAARRTDLPLMPAPPEAVRPSSVPGGAATARPPSPVLTSSTPTGVPIMKPLMPVKAVALAALAATLALPVAQAKPTAPIKHAPAPKPAYTSADALRRDIIAYQKRDLLAYQKAYPPIPAALALHWNALVLQHASPKTLMALLPWGTGGKNPEGVKEIMFSGDNVVLVNATPAAYAQVQEAVRRLDVAPEATPVIPRQVRVKFELVALTSASGTAPDKSVDAMTTVAEEGHMANVSHQHMWNGVPGEETISFLTHLEPTGVVVLDITECNESAAQVGDTNPTSAETRVRVKDGETGIVRLQFSKQGGQSAERVLFVTPTIIQPAADGSVEPRSAPLRDGDIINVNPFSPPAGKVPSGPVPNKAP